MHFPRPDLAVSLAQNKTRYSDSIAKTPLICAKSQNLQQLICVWHPPLSYIPTPGTDVRRLELSWDSTERVLTFFFGGSIFQNVKIVVVLICFSSERPLRISKFIVQHMYSANCTITIAFRNFIWCFSVFFKHPPVLSSQHFYRRSRRRHVSSWRRPLVNFLATSDRNLAQRAQPGFFFALLRLPRPDFRSLCQWCVYKKNGENFFPRFFPRFSTVFCARYGVPM